MKERPARVPRLFVEAQLRQGDRLALNAEAAHHAVRVLRLREGDAVVLFDGRGGEYEARLSLPGRGPVLAELGARRAIERESPLAVTLVQAVSSGEKMDFTIQKAVELGVTAIQPVLAARSLVRLAGEREAKRLAHWRRVAIAACEQCGRNRIPAIAEPLPLERYRPHAAGARLLLSPQGERKLSELAESPLTLAIGPEAGFGAAEEAHLLAAGFTRARLGARVLRTETAALAALAALNALAGDF
ncbi:MAG: 16S rRNA (uracil(1498)-N(3))-methyltransferase [Betaproteobacteria bacterium]|nr:16S rRNA (uracil(1498)-N(3))-methyltransferase [Betaproteobacteria bacterium]